MLQQLHTVMKSNHFRSSDNQTVLQEAMNYMKKGILKLDFFHLLDGGRVLFQ